MPKEGHPITVHFLEEFDKGREIVLHEAWGKLFPTPCRRYFGEKCPFCKGDYSATDAAMWQVFDYRDGAPKLLLLRFTDRSAAGDVLDIWQDQGSIVRGVDIELSRGDDGGQIVYHARALPTKTRRRFPLPWTPDEILERMQALKPEPVPAWVKTKYARRANEWDEG